MSKKCPNCGSKNTKKGRYDNDKSICYVCNDCCFVGDPEEFKELTVFDHITQSVEALANELVYYLPEIGKYTSEIIAVFYKDRSEAIAATVAELKKEWKG